MLACLSHFGNRFMVVEVGPEHPELVVADDPPVALLGLHERGRSPAQGHRSVLPLVTLRVFCLTPEWVLSIRLVEPRHFLSRGGRPSRLIVNISLRPSRRLAEAEGWSRSEPSGELLELLLALLRVQLHRRPERRLHLRMLILRQMTQHVAELVVAAAFSLAPSLTPSTCFFPSESTPTAASTWCEPIWIPSR